MLQVTIQIEVDSRLPQWRRRGLFDVHVAGLFTVMLRNQALVAPGIEVGGTLCAIFRPGGLHHHRVLPPGLECADFQ